MEHKKPQILLTNDDGIESPGLWAAAAALAPLGFVHVVAPREQCTGMGRSLPATSDGIIQLKEVTVNGKTWQVHSVGGSPAQTVIHAVYELMPETPALVVSGINYGENFGTGVTISGTVGAALEGAGLGIPSLAISLEVDKAHHRSHSNSVDFTASAYFTAYFAAAMLANKMPADVDVIKVEVPANATVDTEWAMSKLSRKRYYETLKPGSRSFEEPFQLDYAQHPDLETFDPVSDVYITRVAKKVAVTPLSLDLTSRVGLNDLDALIRGQR